MTRCVNIFILLLLISACSFRFGPDVSEATHILNGDSYPRIKESEVKIFVKKPNFTFAEIGIIEARGMGYSDEKRDMVLAIKALKSEAAKIGANGVIINTSSQDIASITNNGTATERRIKATAIRYSSATNKYTKAGVYAVGCAYESPGEFKYIEKSMGTLNDELKVYFNNQPENITLMKKNADSMVDEFKKLSTKDKYIICNSIDNKLRERHSQPKK